VSPDQLSVSLPSSLDAPAIARLHLRTYASHVPPAVFDDALILTTELVTNAVQHGQPDISLQVQIGALEITVIVTDAGPALPPVAPTMPPSANSRGRGLAIVDAIATGWGVTPCHGQPGKDVWFQLRLS
jgi:anti-sigma regulatory factor (Ser/Thr protein kinase)